MKAIWVMRTFTVETQAKSSESRSGSRSLLDLRKNSVLPAEWAMVPSKDAKMTKRWRDVDVMGGLTKWWKSEDRVHELTR